MKTSADAISLKIFLDEDTILHGKPLYEQIVIKAKELELAGATVVKGIMGYQAHHCIHTAKLLRLSENMPVIIEIVDSEENINKLQPFIDEHLQEGFITRTTVEQIKYQLKKE